MKAAELFVRCLENEGVEFLFGIPGEENLDVMEALRESTIRFIATRHEQGAAFMADVYGRLTGRAGVCLATLGPGATNLVTGVADANMDHAPVVAISGQAATTRMHKESHQHLDLVNLFRPISKYCTQIIQAETVPEVVRKAFKQAEAERPGVSFIDFPENIAEMEVEGKVPLKVQSPAPPVGAPAKIKEAAEMIAAAKHPLILAGNGVVRAGASAQLIALAEHLKLPVATTFMGKGVIPSSHPLCLGTIGLQSRDYVNCGFDRADVIICVGYDLIEYHPHPWNPEKDRQIINISRQPAEVDEHYIIAIGVIGEIGSTLDGIAALLPPREESASGNLHRAIVEEVRGYAEDSSFPMKPAKIVWDLRQVLSPECIVINDVGAHKMWMARMYQAERPNTCIISNGFAAMGISLPGAVAAKLAFPQRTVVAVTGDAGFLMNSQEIETALRIGTPIVILIWNDSGYGLIKWHQLRRFGHSSNVDFSNPDFVKYAESFGAKGYRVGAADELAPVLQQAIADDTVVIIDCPVDYSENMKLTERLGKLVCPI
ncbi:MAG: acetolactate synthase large subunit [Candidatus Nealsonbacteria bacterium]|nr:acetolactate synthase large subunit [Candidatus Nealsonbacteria bacterium]